MNAYNQKQIIKSFEVDSIQQIKGDWFVETMIAGHIQMMLNQSLLAVFLN